MSKKEQLTFFRKLLKNIYLNKSSDFSGIGIVLYKDFNLLPTSSLRKKSKIRPFITDFNEILNTLSTISNKSNTYHDGFHFISQDFHLTHICQYFSPPIINDAPINLKYGGRYRASLYASFLDSVIACGVASNNYEPTIFINGKVKKLKVK